MIRYLLTAIVVCGFFIPVHAQHSFTAIITRARDKSPLAGATLLWKEKKLAIVADSLGKVVITAIPDGKQNFVISYTGFPDLFLSYVFPLADEKTESIQLAEGEDEEEAVVVMATRTSRTIDNTPTRTEIISGEELSEKGNMKPGDIRMLLNESTGMQTQQTSATSFNAGIRIQGLDGRYTQILRDGYPLYSGFSGGLSILQISPLDLRQVEVIKGSASTLYGGGAIAGLVNLVSKVPVEKRQLNFMANGTSARGLDLSGFYSEKYGKAGLTLYASRNTNAPFDPARIGLTAIPKFDRYTVSPRLFLYGKKTTADLGITYITEDRIGGNVGYIKHGGAGYYEENNTDRLSAQLGLAHRLSNRSLLRLKSSYSRFNRAIAIPGYRFEALQEAFFSELTWNLKAEKTDWVAGANLVTDNLKEQQITQDPLRNYFNRTFGVFVQNTWSPSKSFTLESGIRGDFVSHYGFELLPRISALVKMSPALTTRIGGGFGYKTPTVFTEESERIQFQHVLPVEINRSENERSVGGNWDLNYRTSIGKFNLQLNHLFFYTRLKNPLVLVATGARYEFINSGGNLTTRGTETNFRLIYGDLKLFVGYTYTDANTIISGNKVGLPLTARHRLNNVLMYEKENSFKIGLEAYYYSKQQLSDGSVGKDYWLAGLMAEKLWPRFSLFINFENFTDIRQSKFGRIYNGTIDNPVFSEIYAPVEGFVINGGIKINLF